MRILFHNPTCGGGIEQAGYIFLLLLKKLGHKIDLWNTQCARLQEKVISKKVNQYEAVVLNSPHSLSVQRMIKEPLENLYAIVHALEPGIPPFCKILSLNYLYHYSFLWHFQYPNIIFPLTYPYWFQKSPFKPFQKRSYFFIFVGRWIKEKFAPQVKDFFLKNKIYLDVAYLYSRDKNYDTEIIKKIKENQTTDKIYSLLKKSYYLLLPSTTECISFVVGEALVNGCFPIVFETKEQVHLQFFVGYRCYSMEEFVNLCQNLFQKKQKPPEWFYEEFVPFAQKFWSIEKTLSELATVFGQEKKGGSIRVMYNDRGSLRNCLQFKNALIITGEKC